MPDARTKADALGFYLSDPEGLGGARADLEFWPLEPVIEPGIPSIVIEQVSAACGVGLARIVAASATTMQFAAPGEELGEAVTVAANTSTLLESETPGKTCRVYRDAVYNAADLSGELRFELVKGINNSIGLADATVAGETRYGCLWLYNHSDEEITGIEVSATGVYSVALETPTLGRVQSLPDDLTAPTAVTFWSSDTAATLAPREGLALWIRRVLVAPDVAALVEGEIRVEHVYDAVTYTATLCGLYRVSDPALEGFDLYLGEDELPDFDASPAASGALPLSVALAPGHTWHWAVRARSAHDLSSLNTLCRKVTLGAGGENTSEAFTNPEVLSMTSAPGGEVDVRLAYNGLDDATPADYFRLYVRTNGTNPDPDTDSPIDTAMSVTGLVRPTIEAVVKLGPYPYGTPVTVIARVYSSTDEAESNSETVHSLSVTTQAPVGMHQFAVAIGGVHGAGRSQMEGTLYYDAPTNAVGIKTLTGEVVVFGASGEAFRAAFGSQTLFRTAFDFQNVTYGGAGAATPIEAIGPDEIYINVAGIRQARIDFVAGIIEAAAFTLGADRIELPVIGPLYSTSTATNIMVRNSVTGRWTPALRVDNTGRMTIYLPFKQEL